LTALGTEQRRESGVDPNTSLCVKPFLEARARSRPKLGRNRRGGFPGRSWDKDVGTAVQEYDN
jgi:hypothetical protein